MLSFHTPSVALTIAVLASWMSAIFVDFREIPRPSLQPDGAAFSIWLPIFSGLLANAYFRSYEDDTTIYVIVGSLAITTAWSLVMRFKHYGVATALLGSAACVAWYAITRVPDSIAWTKTWAAWPLMLFSGWLVVATALNVVIWNSSLDRPELLLVIGLLVAFLSVTTRQPVSGLAVLWALGLQTTQNAWSIAAFCATLAGCVSGAALSLM